MPSFTPDRESLAQRCAPFVHCCEQGLFTIDCEGSQLAAPAHSPRTHSGTPEPSPVTQVVKYLRISTDGSRGSPQLLVPTLHCSGTHFADSSSCIQTSFTPHCVSLYEV